MEHPEPLTKSVKHLQTMDENHYLYMFNNKNPIPLLEIAKNNGFHSLSYEDDKGFWHILISKKVCNLEEFLDV
jgi:TusA-related sulfurtransferase